MCVVKLSCPPGAMLERREWPRCTSVPPSTVCFLREVQRGEETQPQTEGEQCALDWGSTAHTGPAHSPAAEGEQEGAPERPLQSGVLWDTEEFTRHQEGCVQRSWVSEAGPGAAGGGLVLRA